MKKCFGTIMMLIITLLPLSAQKSKDVLYLKNGSMIDHRPRRLDGPAGGIARAGEGPGGEIGGRAVGVAVGTERFRGHERHVGRRRQGAAPRQRQRRPEASATPCLLHHALARPHRLTGTNSPICRRVPNPRSAAWISCMLSARASPSARAASAAATPAAWPVTMQAGWLRV